MSDEGEQKEEKVIPNHVLRSMKLRSDKNLQDSYYTSEEAVYAMIPQFKETFGEGATIYDCCAGENTPLSRILREQGFSVYENDLYAGGEDFLQMQFPPEGATAFITNFPYSQKVDMLRKISTTKLTPDQLWSQGYNTIHIHRVM